MRLSFAVLVAASCGGVTEVEVEVPASIRSVVVALSDHALGPFDWSPGLSVPYGGDRAGAGLACFEEALPALGARLELAGRCEPRLPPAALWLSAEDGRPARAPERRFRAPWLESRCGAALVLEHVAPESACTLAPAGGCCFSLECGASALPVELDPGGAALEGLPEGCSLAAGEPIGGRAPAYAIRCPSGAALEEAYLWEPSSLEERPLEVARWALIEPARVGEVAREDPSAIEARAGFLADLAPLPRGAAVIVRERFARDTGPNARLAIVDAGAGVAPRFVSAPAGLERLAPSPFGAGFFGAILDGSAALLGFDPEGALLGRRAMEGAVLDLLAHEGRLVVLAAPAELLVFAADPTTSTASPSRLALPVAEPVALAPMDATRFAVLSRGPQKRVLVYDLSLAERGRVELSVGLGGALPTYLSWHEGSGRFLVSDIRRPAAAIHVLGATDLGQSRYYARAGMTPLASAPLGELSVVALAGDEDATQLSLALFDPAARRFLPGSAPLGFGVVSRLVAGADGALWGINPWAGELLRIAR